MLSVLLCRAASSLALWVAALLDYHHARDVVKPFKDKLAAAEKILTKVHVCACTSSCFYHYVMCTLHSHLPGCRRR